MTGMQTITGCLYPDDGMRIAVKTWAFHHDPEWDRI
jgi:hypothetical protein